MTNKQIIVHVGPPKTGTSVIQYWLQSNRKWLESQDIYYPVHDLDSNSVSSGHRNLFLEKPEGSPRATFNHEKFSELLAHFNDKKCGKLLLSSEFFFYQLPEFLKYANYYQLRFIAYVRADFELVESLYNQSVKRNFQTGKLAHRSMLPKSYLDDLITYVSQYSPDYFELRAFGDSEVFGGNIVTDFVQALRISNDICESYLDTKINSSYSFECLEFKRWVNRFKLTQLDATLDQYLQSYQGRINNYSLLPADIYKGYQTQSLEKINALQRVAPISNYEKLVAYVQAKRRGKYIHQDLYPQHLEEVASFLLQRDFNTFEALLNQVGLHAKDEIDIERLKVLERIFETSYAGDARPHWLSKIWGLFKN
tara:strand:- start:2285 stop:3385 length:1101 start_codon:yes stop_codon:yes gene_type:complete